MILSDFADLVISNLYPLAGSPHFLVHDVGIYLRCSDIFMCQKVLYSIDVRALRNLERSKSVSEAMEQNIGSKQMKG